MTNKKFTSKLALGLLALGLLAYIPGAAQAQSFGNTVQAIGSNLSGNTVSAYVLGGGPAAVVVNAGQMAASELSQKANNTRTGISDAQAKANERVAKALAAEAEAKGRPLTADEKAAVEKDAGWQGGSLTRMDGDGRQKVLTEAAELRAGASDAVDDLNAAREALGKSTYSDAWRRDTKLEQFAVETIKEGEAMLAQARREGNAEKIKLAEKIIADATSAKEKLQDRQAAKNLESAAYSLNSVNVYETTDAQGNKVTVYVKNDLTATGGIMKGCIPIAVKLDQTKKCIFCPLFVVLFNTAQAMGKASYDILAKGFANVMLIGLALYLAWVSLKQVSAFTKQDGPKYITEVLTQAFKVLFAYVILMHVQELYDLVLSPLLSAGIEFGSKFLFRAKESGVMENAINFDGCVSASINETTGELSGNLAGMTIADGYYQRSLFAKIDCFMRAVQNEIAITQSIGSSLMCVARNAGSHWYGMWDLTMFFTGLIIWIFSWLICLAFSFYLIDAVVRLGIVGGLMPFLIASWPFKITSSWTGKGWEMFMNTFFTFVFLGMVVSINIELSGQAATGGEGGLEKVTELMNGDKIGELLEIMSIGFTGLLFLILCCIFGFKLCSEAIQLAAQMSGAKPQDLGSKVGMAAAAGTKWAAGKTAKGAGAVGKGVGKWALNNTRAGRSAAEGFGNMKSAVSDRLKGLGKKFGGAAGIAGKSDSSKGGKKGGANNAQPTPTPGGGRPPAGNPAETGEDPTKTNNAANNNAGNRSGSNDNNGGRPGDTQQQATPGANPNENAAGDAANRANQNRPESTTVTPETDAANAAPRGEANESGTATGTRAEVGTGSAMDTSDVKRNAEESAQDTINRDNDVKTDAAKAEAAAGSAAETQSRSENQSKLKTAQNRIKHLEGQISKLKGQIRDLQSKQGSTQSNKKPEDSGVNVDPSVARLDNGMTVEQLLETLANLEKEKTTNLGIIEDLKSKLGQ